MTIIDMFSTVLLLAGALFFLAGTIALLRFPDVYCRLHALAKADNLGLGCVLAGVALQTDSLLLSLKILLIWPLVLAASGAVGFAIARQARIHAVMPWRGDDK